MKTYGQYCPIARTSELLAERWTPIIIRNLLAGCGTFGELLNGAPGISKALLAQRLELLERNGIIVKHRVDGGRVRYDLTERGRDLKSVTDAMGHWGARWLELEPHHLDPSYVLWATCRLIDLDLLPEAGIVVRVELPGESPDRYWLLLRRPYSELCTAYLGWEEDIVITTDTETLARWHLRHVSYEDAIASGRLRVDGSRSMIRLLRRALRASPFAGTQPQQA